MTTDDAPLFPDEAAPRRGRRRLVIAVLAVAAVLLAAVGTSFASGTDGAELVTASAGVQDIASELHGVATIEPVVQAAVAFPADGTVATVDVAVGDTVAVGQQLASLDLEELTDQLHAAEATLAQADLVLQKALDGEDVGGSTDTGGLTPASTDTSSDTATSSDTGTGTATGAEVIWAVASQAPTGDAELAALQQAVLTAQQAVDQALAASEAALAAADAVCTAAGTPDAAEDAAGSATTPTDTTTSEDTDLDACRTALDEVLAAQQATAAAQQQLAAASTALDQYLLAQDTSGSGGTSSGGSTSGGSSSAPSGGTSSSSSSPSAAELVAYQQQVDAAALGVAVAQQAIAQATVVAPIAGTVVAIGVDAGDDVTAASATQTITVQGRDGMEAVTTVALDQVTSVQVGQLATVVPDGSDVAIEGEVVAVSAVPDDDATTTSYRVTIGFVDDSEGLGNGTIGSVTILTDDVRSALAVPTSAVTWQDGRAIVTVVADGEPSATNVEVGVIGAEWIEVRSGVAEGDEVVLADPAEALPGSATDTTSSSSGATAGGMAGGGFPSGGLPSGGFPGGGAGGMPGN